MTQNDILGVMGITSSGPNRILRNDAEILAVIKNAHRLAAALDADSPKADTWSIQDVADNFKKHGLIKEQEPKTGHWIWQTEDIYRCSECGNDIRVKEVMNIPQYVRCPMCEAKMIESQESEE